MLTLEECLDCSELSREEVREIADHHHLPEVLAAALGHALLNSPTGLDTIRGYLLQNLEKATLQGDVLKVRKVATVINRLATRVPNA
jgi:hypothetical protein